MALFPKFSLREIHESMDTRDIMIKYMVIIIFGVAVFYLDELEILDASINTPFIIIISLSKTAFFVHQSLRKIYQVINKNVAYFRFLIFMTVNILTIVMSFGVDFFCLYQVDHSHFSGLSDDFGYMRLIFEFIYMSMLGFNNLGFYDVIPASVAAKSLVMVEILIYYFSIVLILSDFISLRDSIIEDRIKRKVEDKME
jgi:hypothetical protein